MNTTAAINTQDLRVGTGLDSHRLARGRKLILGGVEIESELGLDGHSDADVLTHALIDALLGAAALGDIGTHFPDTDEQYRDADSLVLLGKTVQLLKEAGYSPGNVDVTVALEQPKIGSYRNQIRERLAETLGLPVSAVSVKATTGERVGFIGRGEGALAVATASIGPISA